MKAEPTLFAVCARGRVVRVDYMNFTLSKKVEGAGLTEEKREYGKKGLVLGVSIVLPFI